MADKTIRQLFIIDSSIANYESLLGQLPNDSACVVLQPGANGIEQMASAAASYSNLDSIQIISHGSVGALYLGNVILSLQNIDAYNAQLQALGRALSPIGDLLLYGCNVAQGVNGENFIEALAQATGADVAASEDLTSSGKFGGDLVLERMSGQIDSQAIAFQELEALAVNTAPTFTVSDGIRSTDLGGFDRVFSVIQQADGMLVAAGISDSYFAMVRYNLDGTLDSSFDGDGKAITDLYVDYGWNYSHTGLSFIELSDGKLLLGGNMGLVRYNIDGTQDVRLVDGYWPENFSFDEGSLIQQADGKIVVAGTANGGFAVVRYNLDGSLDTSFDSDGVVATEFSNTNYEVNCRSVIQQTDGKLVIAGNLNGDFAVARYNSDGSLDTSFDSDGILTTDLGRDESVFKLIQQADGKLVVAGISNGHLALTRYNTDGTLDAGFSSDGKLHIFENSGRWPSYVDSLVQQKDGKLIVSGYAGSLNGGVLRLNIDGSLDTTFDLDGVLDPSVFSASVIQQQDSQIIVAGSFGNDFGVARYNLDGSNDVSFSPAEITLGNTVRFYENQGSITLANQVQIHDAELAAAGNYNGSSVTLSRAGGANTYDVFGLSGSNLIQGGYFSVENITIGRVTTNSAGVLKLTFNNKATETLVNRALQDVTYFNTSNTPPESVVINWVFNDGNVGDQGTGGALSVMGSTTVNITAMNDAPIAASPLQEQTVKPDVPFEYNIPTGIFIDPDGDALTYSVRMQNGTPVPPWIEIDRVTGRLFGTPDPLDAGEIILIVIATDPSGASAWTAMTVTVEGETSLVLIEGTSGQDNLVGTIASDSITGLAGNDTLAASAGSDLLDGGDDIDWAVFDMSFGLTYSNYGVQVSLLIDGEQTYTNEVLGANVTLVDIENLKGSKQDDTLIGNDFDNILDGNFGTDVLIGGLGTDTYIIDRIGDKIIEDENEGVDFVQASCTYTLGDNLENIQLTGTSNISAVGNSLDNVLIGNAGSNVLNGGAGIDTVSFNNATKAVVANLATKRATGFGTDTLSNIENLIGSNFNDSLTGSTSANKLEGGSGNDSIDGGSGSDTVVYSLSRANYTITFNSGTSVYTVKANSGNEGTDTVKNIENFSFSDGVLAASSLIDAIAPTVSAFSPTDGATGVAVGSNIVLTFSEAIQNGTGTIYLRTGSASGTIIEQFNAATSDRITIVDRTLTIDPTNNLSGNTQYFVTFASGTVKDLAGNAYTGTSTYDFRTGAAPINGTAGNDTLTGTAAADVINGLAGNDLITGAAAVDSMDGGEGSDLYIISTTADHSAAEIKDTGASGTDEVRFTATITSTLTLYAGDTGIETVVIGTGTAANAVSTGTTALNLNAAAVLNGLSITGNAGANSLTGTSYADNLIGNAGNDSIIGGTGNDTITGGVGADSLTGGLGSDTFVFTAGSTGQTTNIDSITDFAKGAVGTGDLIDYTSALTIGGSNAAATSSQAQINATTGIATFASGSGTTLTDALADIASRFTTATNSAGEFAFFKVNNAGNYYAFVSDGSVGVTANDVVIQLLGISTIGSINLTNGDLSIFS